MKQIKNNFLKGESLTLFIATAYFKGTLTKKKKNGVPKSKVHVIKHGNFQLYREHTDGVIWKKPTIDGNHINKRA